MESTVGVPLISPVDVSRVRPVGSAGVTDHEITVPPSYVGDSGFMARSTV